MSRPPGCGDARVTRPARRPRGERANERCFFDLNLMHVIYEHVFFLFSIPKLKWLRLLCLLHSLCLKKSQNVFFRDRGVVLVSAKWNDITDYLTKTCVLQNLKNIVKIMFC
jgi:hypothetical protein